MLLVLQKRKWVLLKVQRDDENIEKEAILSSYACNEENVDSSTEDIKGKKNNIEHDCKKSNIASSKKKLKVRLSKKKFRVRPLCEVYGPIIKGHF